MVNLDKKKVLSSIAVALIFLILSSAIPAVYYTIAPADQILDVEQTNIEQQNDSIEVEMTYKSNGDWSTDMTTTLLRKNDGETFQTVDSWSGEQTLKSGTHSTELSLAPTTKVEPGVYALKFEMTVQTDSYVERTVTNRTEVFYIEEPIEAQNTTSS